MEYVCQICDCVYDEKVKDLQFLDLFVSYIFSHCVVAKNDFVPIEINAAVKLLQRKSDIAAAEKWERQNVDSTDIVLQRKDDIAATRLLQRKSDIAAAEEWERQNVDSTAIVLQRKDDIAAAKLLQRKSI